MVRRLFPFALAFLAACASAPGPAPEPYVRPAPEPIAWPNDSRAVQLQLLNRVAWGANRSSAGDIASVGSGRWLDAQLHPSPAPLPAEMQARMDALTTTQRPLAEVGAELEKRRRALRAAAPEERKQQLKVVNEELQSLARETQARMLLRAIYSPNQLEEHVSWFWLNHFNVFQYKGPLRALVADYEERAIRPHALGRFRDLLGATAKHPAMLVYLDNARSVVPDSMRRWSPASAAGMRGRGMGGRFGGRAAARGPLGAAAARRPTGINENYARELMELHTLGI